MSLGIGIGVGCNVRLGEHRRIGDLARLSPELRIWSCDYDPGVLYGRDPERARIGALLEAARASRSGVLVLRGEPGIGKSALLEDTRDRASDMHVLRSRGVESESDLPFAALHQLLRPALGHIDQLPPPQAGALAGALGLAEGSGEERFLVFAACLSLLSELAERRPVLCLVDDAHWLDTSSADALRFVARRLDAEGILIIFAAREGEAHAFEAADLPSLVLEGLDTEAAATLLARGAGVDAVPAVRSRLVEQTRGNALALLEVPSALTPAQLAGEEPLPEALPMTRQVESVFLERVRRLPEDAQRFLLVAAADDSENAGLVTRAAERLSVGPDALDTAEQAGLLLVRGLRLEFRHPLVRSAVYDVATSSERRAAHRALADVTADDEEQADRHAWHLAASVLDPDETVVLALEEAAARAETRGAYAASSRALERAAELSANGETRGPRLVGAARTAGMAGLHLHAAALANQALPLVTEPLQRAEIAQVLGVAEVQRGQPLTVVRSLTDAAKEIAPVDPAKALELLLYAMHAGSEGGNLAAHRDAAELASELTLSVDDDWSRCVAHLLVGCSAMVEGDSMRGAPVLEEALGLAFVTDDARLAYFASACALWIGDTDRTMALASRAVSLARMRGAIVILAGSLGVRASQLFLAQRFDEAVLAATEALKLATETGSENFELLGLAILAAVAAIRGDDDLARRRGEEVLERATARGLAVRAASARRALALIDLGRGRWSEALEQLDALSETPPGFSRPLVALMSAPDRLEAAVRAGRADKARLALEMFEEWATSSEAVWARPRLASCRAMATEGEVATGHFEEALRLLDDARPFDRARIHLIYGEHLRRERQRLEARTQLRAALEGFEALGAEPWAERARSELRASGETARKRDPSTLSQLTPQELQIARLVAQGLSNKEVAAQLFLSPRTIDSHLRNVFAKLGITSRIQLARLPLGEDVGLEVSAEAASA
jgi:ATP/maltotriose-dependent transcriptional regulator MalT